MKPISARHELQVAHGLVEDNFSAKGFWILVDGSTVNIIKQELGEPAKESITIPKEQFDPLLEWYQRDQPDPPKDAPDA